jgi:hypothetical protein
MFGLSNYVYSEKIGEFYVPTKEGYNAFDAWIENVTEYGDIKITLKYIGPSPENRKSGLSIDYISLIPDF